MNNRINVVLPKIYFGQIKDFPPVVVKKMLERQVSQGNEPNLTVFEKDKYANKVYGGFDWNDTPEGVRFWHKTIVKKEFDEFFKKYPYEKIEEESNYPRLMLVSHDNIHFFPRVVFCEKQNLYIAWAIADSIEKADKETSTSSWEYAKEIAEKKEEDEKKYSRKEVVDKIKAYAMFLSQRKGQLLPTLEPLDKWIEKNL